MAGSCQTEKSVCGKLLEIILACVLTLEGASDALSGNAGPGIAPEAGSKR
ncbi:MAG: hypothetical protein Q4P24_16975 [Rhodobacterales bacterium]|nr:hypothetical protein [Rhodobacterales bacterium]